MPKIQSETWKKSFIDKFNNFNELRLQGRYCDITLCSRDKINISAHRIILDTGSGYFRDLFSMGIRDSDVPVLELNNMCGRNLEKVICFIYRGEIDLDEDKDIEIVAQYANYLQINELVVKCIELLENSINDENYLRYWRLADECFHEKLQKLCTSYILRSPKKFFEQESFLNALRPSEMKALLKDARLHYSEEFKFEQLMKWAKYQSKDKEQFSSILLELIDVIQFSLMSKEFIFLNILGNDDLLANVNVFKKIVELTKPKLTSPVNSSSIYSSLLNPYSMQMTSKRGLFTIIKDCLRIVSEEGNLNFLQDNKVIPPWFAYTTFNNYFLVCGGKKNPGGDPEGTRFCEYHNPVTKEWKEFPRMLSARQSHECIFLDNKIYACGNSNRFNPSSNVEFFDFGKDKWILGPSMQCARYDFGLTSLNQALYAVGGRENVSVIECLDPRSNIGWTKIYSQFYNATYTECIAIGTNIYCFQSDNLPCIFDTKANKLREFGNGRDFVIPRGHFKVCEMDERFYVIQKSGNFIDFHVYNTNGDRIHSNTKIIRHNSEDIGCLVALNY